MSKGNSDGSRYGKVLGIIGNILLWVALIAYFVIVPLYFVNGYERIATRKYKCFMEISKYAAMIIGGFILIYLSTWGFNKEERAVFKPLWKIDLGMLFFLAICFLSYKISPYKIAGAKEDGDWFYEGSLYGARGWFMGFMTFLILVFLYFAISRFFTYTHLIWIPILLTASLTFAWGMLNRYGVYPIDMEYAQSTFISSFGNINWFAGFVSVIAPIVVGMFYAADSNLKYRLLIIPLVLSNTIVFLNNSDSIVLGYVVMFFALFLFSLDDKEKMVRFSRTFFSFTAVGMGLFFMDKALPGMKEGTSSFAEIFTKGATSIIIFVVSLIFVAIMGLCEEGKIKYSEKVGKTLRKIFLIAAIAGFSLGVILITVNTVTGGALPIIGQKSVFLFSKNWGSDRGATWSAGALLFKDLSFGRKLIGVGPDMFYFGLKECEEAYALSESVFGNSRLTNAHNELLTLMVNVGILGVAAYIFMFVSAAKLFMNKAKDNLYIVAFALSIICHITNNMFSFQQITGTPFFFLVIALGAAAVAKHESK